jgi:hypothetical protein
MTPDANISALCHEFTNALTKVLAENAVGLARRGRIARTHAAFKRHPEYNEHSLCVAVEPRLCGGKLYKTMLRHILLAR